MYLNKYVESCCIRVDTLHVSYVIYRIQMLNIACFLVGVLPAVQIAKIHHS